MSSCFGHYEVADEAIYKLAAFLGGQHLTRFAVLLRRRSKLVTRKNKILSAPRPKVLVDTVESTGAELIPVKKSLPLSAMVGSTIFLSDRVQGAFGHFLHDREKLELLVRI